jgi:hypothetical protein
MTTTMTLTPRSIGQTENALRALLVRALSGSDLDYHGWVALTLIARSDPPLDEASVTSRLVDVLKIDAGAASTAVGGLAFSGLVEEHGGMDGTSIINVYFSAPSTAPVSSTDSATTATGGN